GSPPARRPLWPASVRPDRGHRPRLQRGVRMSAFAEFARTARDLAPRAAVVLGSGLGGATAQFRESASVAFGDVPGLVPATVRGHRGRLAVGLWGDTPALFFLGRLHFYEGHSREVVTGPVRVAADLG